ncbi:hypothetical protein ACFQ08_13905 [Streptosporangium algeriense]|uniref:Tat pathway signal sequence domain protein n=1 Tax=Streptosporangium algeriense TaxID=1682748 RepID=A0ABW3DR46_9ACTN
MSFEEQILMQMKAEITARADRRRIGRRLFTGAAVAGLAAAATIAVPLLTGSEQAAYAVTRNTDGTINVKLNEFRDADKLEQDLKRMGVSADITYLKSGKACQGDRGDVVGGASPEEWEGSASAKAVRLLPRGGGLEIDPRYVGNGQTLVMMLTENKDRVFGTERSGTQWQLPTYVVNGQVKPCVVVDDPLWNDVDGSGGPPAGS